MTHRDGRLIRAASLAALMFLACGAPADPGDVVNATVDTAVSFAGQTYPEVSLTINGSGTSSRGNVVIVSATTVNGVSVTSPVVVTEGNHSVCVTATSSTAVSATTCRSVQVTWPRFQGRAALYGAQGIAAVPGLSVSIDDETAYLITSTDGSFSIPSDKARLVGSKLLFTGSGSVAPALVRYTTFAPVYVVMLPTKLTIPPCSVYGTQVVDLDIGRAFAPASAGQTSFLDRTSTIINSGRVVVASWNASSIPVALSDTGGPTKQFSAADSAEVATALSTITSYVCQGFHLALVSEASAGGVVVFKDPTFAALGAHSMAIPATRGDYTRADVVLRTLVPANSTARDSTRRTVMHEFFHVLGFGHSCSWPTVMTTGTTCASSLYALVPSRQDVAHYFAMRYARQGERQLSSLQSLGPAYVASQVANGQSGFQLHPYFNQP